MEPKYYQYLDEDEYARYSAKRKNMIAAGDSVVMFDKFIYGIVSAKPSPGEALTKAPAVSPTDNLMNMVKENPMIAAGAVLGILFLLMRKKRA